MTMVKSINNLKPFQMWLAALCVFWGATFITMGVDYFGQYYFDHHWAMGPDLFPNATLGPVLAVFQVLSALILFISALRIGACPNQIWNWCIRAFYLFINVIFVFGVYAFMSLYWQIEIMKRRI